MEYRWKIKITLNSGKELEGYYKGPESNSDDVAQNLFAGGGGKFNDRVFRAIANTSGTEQIFYCLQDVSAFSISKDF